MENEKNINEQKMKRKREPKDETFMFRLTETDDEMLQRLSYSLDRSRSDIMRRALKLFYYAMEDQLD
jgi:predicted transcriptional regulator